MSVTRFKINNQRITNSKKQITNKIQIINIKILVLEFVIWCLGFTDLDPVNIIEVRQCGYKNNYLEF